MASLLSNILAPSLSLSLFSLPPSSSPSSPPVSLYHYQRQREEERYLEQIITTGLAGGCLLYFSRFEHSHFVVSILQILPVSRRRRNILCRHRSDDSLHELFLPHFCTFLFSTALDRNFELSANVSRNVQFNFVT